MFGKKILPGLKQKKTQRIEDNIKQRLESQLSDLEGVPVSCFLDVNANLLQHTLGKSDDLVIRHFCIGGIEAYRAALVYIDGLTDSSITNQFVMKATMLDLRDSDAFKPPLASELGKLILKQGLPVNEVSEADTLRNVTRSILSGDSVLLIDQMDKAILISTKGWERRGVEEPRTESVVRGPRNGFTETLRVNTAQIRLRLKDPSLRVKNMTVGKRSNTDIAVMYLEDVADMKVVNEVMRRIEAIEIDAVQESGYIEQYIEDSSWTPFPLIQNTERPDKATSNLLEGKVIIISDGTPFVLIAPAIFSQFYHSPEDYYERFLIGTLIRLIRILSMGIALLLPSLYIAFSSFHPEMIPSRLVIAMAAGRSTVPFPSIVEALLMEVTMEILREAREMIRIRGKKNGGYISFPYKGNPDQLISISMEYIKMKDQYSYVDHRLQARLRVFVEVDLLGKTFDTDFSDLQEIKSLETSAATYLENGTKAVINKLQKQYHTDILGIGSKVKAFHPGIWKKLQWNEDFSKADIQVTYDVKMRRTGMEMQ